MGEYKALSQELSTVPLKKRLSELEEGGEERTKVMWNCRKERTGVLSRGPFHVARQVGTAARSLRSRPSAALPQNVVSRRETIARMVGEWHKSPAEPSAAASGLVAPRGGARAPGQRVAGT